MGRILTAGFAVILALSYGTILALSPQGGTLTPLAAGDTISLWEAYSKGFITVEQVNLSFTVGGNPGQGPLGYQIRSTSGSTVAIDEFVILLSPNPREAFVGPTAQDGSLTKSSIPPGGRVTYGYGDYVAQGILPGPAWWCSEERQFVLENVRITLGGELLPFAMESMVQTLVPVTTQDTIWSHLRTQPTLVVGKTVDSTFWKEVPETAGQSLQVVIHATNLAIRDDLDGISPDPNAPAARVWDRVPAGFVVDPGSVTPGASISSNPDGSTTIAWTTNLPAADVTNRPADYVPTPYESRKFAYRVTTPHLTPGRLSLPRALVSVVDDGIADAQSAVPLLDILRVRLPPNADAGPGYVSLEGDTITFSAAGSTDPNGDPLEYRWDFTADGTWDTTFSPDPMATWAFGDDFSGFARVQASDGELMDTAMASVLVQNADPTIDGVRVTASGDLKLRVAGEKWHDVTLEVVQGGTRLAVSVVRMPGSPDEQAATLEDVEIELTEDVSITVYYTPDDDPVNGQRPGANPVWVIFESGAGEIRLHHTFNVNHPDTWVWTLDDIAPQLLGLEIGLVAEGADIGSDDMTMTVDWSDGTTASETVFRNGVGPDPNPSPDLHPVAASFAFAVAYATAGTYTITVTLLDDDGGSATTTVTITVG